MAGELKTNTNSMLAVHNGSGYPLLRQVLRQAGLLFSLAASVALGAAIVLWSQSPDYTTLYSDLPDIELSQVAGALEQNNIKYKLSSDGIMVAANDVEKSRMQLASQGLPNLHPERFNRLNEQQNSGSGQFIQSARYQYVLEEKLARTISALRQVKSARIHLVLPQSDVVRNQKNASASVMVSLYSGYRMSNEQISAIAYIVASSVPNLSVEEVTVVDQMGRLLSTTEAMGLNSEQLEYTNKLEHSYIERVNNILTPFLGRNGFRAQVGAEIDFIRTENIGGAAESEKGSQGVSKNKAIISRNINKLSVALVVDNKKLVADDGAVSNIPRTEDEIKQITLLVKEAVGFNAQRGDTVNIINTGFVEPETVAALPVAPLWEQKWFLTLVKQIVAVLLVLYIIFGVIKPIFKSLSKPRENVNRFEEEVGKGQAALVAEPQAAGDQERDVLAKSYDYDSQLDKARKTVGDDPKIAAQVVKNWLAV